MILALAGCSYEHNRPARNRGADEPRAATAPRKDGIFHPVKKGENLYRIGKAYGVHHQTLARINRITDTRDIRIGRRLFIPEATRLLPVEIITPIKRRAAARAAAPGTSGGKAAAPKARGAKAAAAKAPGVAVARPAGRRSKPTPAGNRAAAPRPARDRNARRPSPRQGFAWPVKGKVTGKFDSRLDSPNDGINIAAPPGTPVHATLAGQVIYSDKLRGYGNLIILRHRRGYASVYAHNRKNLVRQGQQVNHKQVIAEVGATGRAATPQLHFEIRRNNVARDPLFYLP